MMIYIKQWRSLWKALGVDSCNHTLLDELLICYSEPHRKYHTTQHLFECFEQFSKVRALADHPEEVELALWFHDAIYDVRRHDNETRSAQWAKRMVLESGLGEIVAQRVYDLVMVTQHDAVPIDRDAKILVDIDLSILGTTPERFEAYEQHIREEYAWVPELEFRLKRLQILEAFKMRSQIFNTEYFQDHYEVLARQNLCCSIQSLKTIPW
jgi:predicted metal-dependent HD superfamily phosphohydrolase